MGHRLRGGNHGNGSDGGPLRKVVGICSVGGVRMEAYECGHVAMPKSDIVGETNAARRRCRRCKLGKPVHFTGDPPMYMTAAQYDVLNFGDKQMKRKVPPPAPPFTLVPGTVVRIDVTWLDGGRKDDFPVLTKYPAKLADLAAALESFNGADEGHDKAAAVLYSITDRDVVANSPTRFVAIVGSELENGPPDGKCLVEIQDLPLCNTAAFGLDGDTDVRHLIDMKGNG